MRIDVNLGGSIVLGVAVAAISLTTANASRKTFQSAPKPAQVVPQKSNPALKAISKAPLVETDSITSEVVNNPLSF